MPVRTLRAGLEGDLPCETTVVRRDLLGETAAFFFDLPVEVRRAFCRDFVGLFVDARLPLALEIRDGLALAVELRLSPVDEDTLRVATGVEPRRLEGREGFLAVTIFDDLGPVGGLVFCGTAGLAISGVFAIVGAVGRAAVARMGGGADRGSSATKTDSHDALA